MAGTASPAWCTPPARSATPTWRSRITRPRRGRRESSRSSASPNRPARSPRSARWCQTSRSSTASSATSRKTAASTYPDAVLERLDIVLASLHESHGHSPARLLQRYERVMRHPLVNVITHPANRSPGRQPGYALAFERLFEHAARTGTAVEIDGAPGHLDLDCAAGRNRRGHWCADPRSTATAIWPTDWADRCGSASGWRDGRGSRKPRCSTHATSSAIRDFVAAKREGRPWQA